MVERERRAEVGQRKDTKERERRAKGWEERREGEGDKEKETTITRLTYSCETTHCTTQQEHIVKMGGGDGGVREEERKREERNTTKHPQYMFHNTHFITLQQHKPHSDSRKV